MALEGEQSLKMWLDPQGQIYQSLVRFKCGVQPKQVLFTPDGKELWVSILGGGVSGLEAYDPLTGEEAGIRLSGRARGHRAHHDQGRQDHLRLPDGHFDHLGGRSGHPEGHPPFPVGGSFTKILLLSRDEKTAVRGQLAEQQRLRDRCGHREGPAGPDQDGHDSSRPVHRPGGKYLYVAGFGVGEIQKIDLATGKGTVL